jgi:integrase
MGMRDPAEPLPAATTTATAVATAAVRRPEVPASPAEMAAAGYRAAADAPETLRAYRADLACFRAWCAGEGRPAAIPAARHRGRLPRRAGAALPLATLRRRSPRWPAPTARPATASTPATRDPRDAARHRRRHGAPQRRAAALATAEVRKLVAACRGDLAGLRDRALLLLGYAAALRRSELAAVEHEHLRFTADGLELLLPRSKGDQAGEGARVGVPRGQKVETCPVRAVEAWLRASAIRYGPVFVPGDPLGHGGAGQGALRRGVRLVLRRRAEQAGVEGTWLEPVSPHGLRAGFVTQATRAGLPDEAIMAHTRHRDAKTMRRYVRRARLLDDSPARKLGL